MTEIASKDIEAYVGDVISDKSQELKHRMTVCDVCLGNNNDLHEENGILYCSDECYDGAKANPELFKKARKLGIALL